VERNGEEVTVWGKEDPSSKYEKVPQHWMQDFFRQYKKVNFSQSNRKDDARGYGWQWDDYHYAYSAEKSPFPIYGNLMTAQNINNRPVISPQHFRAQLFTSDRQMKNVQRDFHSNTFYYNPGSYNGMKRQVPCITSAQSFAVLAA